MSYFMLAKKREQVAGTALKQGEFFLNFTCFQMIFAALQAWKSRPFQRLNVPQQISFLPLLCLLFNGDWL